MAGFVDTHLELGQVGGGEGLVQMLGDLLPGGEPLVPVLLPSLMVLLPGTRRERALHLQQGYISISANIRLTILHTCDLINTFQPPFLALEIFNSLLLPYFFRQYSQNVQLAEKQVQPQLKTEPVVNHVIPDYLEDLPKILHCQCRVSRNCHITPANSIRIKYKSRGARDSLARR